MKSFLSKKSKKSSSSKESKHYDHGLFRTRFHRKKTHRPENPTLIVTESTEPSSENSQASRAEMDDHMLASLDEQKLREPTSPISPLRSSPSSSRFSSRFSSALKLSLPSSWHRHGRASSFHDGNRRRRAVSDTLPAHASYASTPVNRASISSARTSSSNVSLQRSPVESASDFGTHSMSHTRIPSDRSSGSFASRTSAADSVHSSTDHNKLAPVSSSYSASSNTSAEVSRPQSTRSSIGRASFEIDVCRLSDFENLKPSEGESANEFLERVQSIVPARFIAALLSTNNSPLHQMCLRMFFQNFRFNNEPLDMSLRKLLAICLLPRETQQIDRVLSAFSEQYYECNPNLYNSADECYILSFSLMILHTDAFNVNNRRKMTRSEFITNTNLPDILPEILECFYDNIVFTPFVHLEDDTPFSSNYESKESVISQLISGASISSFVKKHSLPKEYSHFDLSQQTNAVSNYRPNLKAILDEVLNCTISTTGTQQEIECATLHQAFLQAPSIQIISLRSQPKAFSCHFAPDPANESSAPAIVHVKVFKVGVLLQRDLKRKDIFASFREWGLMLTSSQLMFFRSVSKCNELLEQQRKHDMLARDTDSASQHSDPLIFEPPVESLNADYVVPLSNLIAYTDNSNGKRDHCFNVLRNKNEQFVLAAESDEEMNDWISRLNYVSAFATAGINLRGPCPKGEMSPVDSVSMSMSMSIGSMASSDTQEILARVSHEDGMELLRCSSYRTKTLQQRIKKLEVQLAECARVETVQRRNTYNLTCMMPVQSRTRNRLIHAASSLAHRMHQQMLHKARLERYLCVLRADLELDREFMDCLHNFFPERNSLPPESSSPNIAAAHDYANQLRRSLSTRSRLRCSVVEVPIIRKPTPPSTSTSTTSKPSAVASTTSNAPPESCTSQTSAAPTAAPSSPSLTRPSTR
ncbi:guanyl-nucleotide exchange factor Sec74 [Schizosaccharomyces japonicus yFS275]|uniref:Guanyl-nucleotide exchange factor Sec74 n=1 Tax=Schizosaccharomyces japonicus (strain yFS275 / FY16936) TaxID=402676 RepID=B6JZG5_SCHJY|nr:guanyl-nucleotide exchange factor Sec74 [Schizosaccharomyces japonicus yFS275]EEB06933.1 guanyl-nucleotide exchange factor Sec74 [Schizosaccharomyces japonicus yFS275]